MERNVGFRPVYMQRISNQIKADDGDVEVVIEELSSSRFLKFHNLMKVGNTLENNSVLIKQRDVGFANGNRINYLNNKIVIMMCI